MDISDNHFPESDIVADIYSGEINFDEEDFSKIESIVVGFELLYMEGDYLEGELRKSTKTFIFSKGFFLLQTFSFGGQTSRLFWQRRRAPLTGGRQFQTTALPNFCQTFCSIPMGERTWTDSCLRQSSSVVSRLPKLRYTILRGRFHLTTIHLVWFIRDAL